MSPKPIFTKPEVFGNVREILTRELETRIFRNQEYSANVGNILEKVRKYSSKHGIYLHGLGDIERPGEIYIKRLFAL